MTRAYDNWGRLVGATLKREELRRVAREDSLSSSSDFDLSFRLNESALNFQDMGISFTEQQIIKATGNFSKENLIKHNDSGDLFRGILNFREVKKSGHGSIHAVIKRIDLRLVTGEAYMSELEGISKLSISNPCPLLGHCWEKETVKFIVYSLSKLDWKKRMEIAIRVAKGLKNLHYHDPPLVHGDVQTSSVFLDGNWEEQIKRLTQGYDHVKNIGTLCGIIRNTAEDTLDTPKERFAGDIYCFGLILLELVTGELGASELTGSALEYWLQKKLDGIRMCKPEIEYHILNVMDGLNDGSLADDLRVYLQPDPTLMLNDVIAQGIWRVAAIAIRCLEPEKFGRKKFKIDMDHVLKSLEVLERCCGS
ncbi:unnamed protein product [Fraxinus pennsylvanica]|uniref:Protein kinase domain-containing protein n=1 Tax=Fraxinus pennsylvanica TaxID=56036 RepID=A0AAD2ADW3_9LAMI|nr:unnamed protein product [Fraxinus pennsylvanica]